MDTRAASDDAFFSSLMDSLTISFHHGVAMRLWPPHRDSDWRILPYATIVAMADCKADYLIRLEGREPILLPPSHAFVIPAGQAFQLELLQPAFLCNAHASFSILDQIDLFSFFHLPGPIGGEAAGEIIRLCGELARCEARRKESPEDLYQHLHMKQLLLSLLDTVLRCSEPLLNMRRRLSELQRIEQVIRYINRHFSEPISRRTLAELVHLSETRFHYVFRDIMGMPPMTYLTLFRLKKAQAMLLTTDASVTRIAQSSGFESIAHFSRLFKRYYHSSPLNYRHATALYIEAHSLALPSQAMLPSATGGDPT